MKKKENNFDVSNLQIGEVDTFTDADVLSPQDTKIETKPTTPLI